MGECTKVKYLTRSEAKKILKKLNKEKHLAKPLTNVYYHSDCGYWHLTSGNKTSSRNYTRRLNKSK